MSVTIRDAMLLPCTAGMPVVARGWLRVEGTRIAASGAGDPPDADGVVVDAGGDIVMPGFVNPHAHLPMTLFRGLGEDVDDRLFRYVLPLERRFVTPWTVAVGTRLAALESIRAGVTTVADMYYHEVEVGRVLNEAGLRGVVGQTIADFDPPDHATIDAGFALTDALVDAFGGHPRITPSVAPHAPYSTDVGVMARVAAWADANPGAPVQIHLAEMASEMAWAARLHGSRPVAVVDRAGLLRAGLIAAHCLYLDEAEVALLAERGVRVAHNPRSNAKAGRGIAPVEALRAAGVPVGLATDGPMSGNTLDLFAQMGVASMLGKLRGRSRAPLPAADVVRMATAEGADVLGLPVGRLEPGRPADLIRVSVGDPRMQPLYDPYAALVFAAQPEDVRDVMVDGRWLMRDRVVDSVDAARALRDAGQVARTFRAEMARIDEG